MTEVTISSIVKPDLDVVVVGAGFGGIYALYALRERGFDVRGFEAGGSVGGTWYWNRYPGARCDVESLSYQYSFSQELVDEWTWSERYATQPEILAYAEWVADRIDVRRMITFHSRVTSAVFDEADSLWVVTTETGEVVTARFVITAAGGLSAAQVPPFDGVHDYRGEVYHPGHWPAGGVDFTGKRVAVVGVGSSGVQLIPEVAKEAAELVVFQRTPAYTVPARNRPLYADEIITARRNHKDLTESARRSYAGINLPLTGDNILETPEPRRTVMLEKNWKLGGNLFITAFLDVSHDLAANEVMADFVRAKIKDTVDDPEVARRLTPIDYPIGGKRLVTDTDFYATFNLPRVRLVSLLEEPIDRIEEDGIRTAAGKYPVDAIVYATGYDSMTGSLTRIDIRGRNGLSLRDSWRQGVHSYLGVATSGFPNLFTITGPESPSVLVNVIAAIEQHVEWIADCLVYLREHGVVSIEAQPERETWWAQQVEDAASRTMYVHARSWYRGSNIDGKATRFLAYAGGLDVYDDICRKIANNGYDGFVLTRATVRAGGVVG